MRPHAPRRPGLASAVLALVALGHAPMADGSTVRRLSPAALADGADLVVTARVASVTSRWAADRRGLETVVELEPDDPARPALTIVQPGGELGGARQLVVGMPTYQVGERARFHLRANPDGATWRVYGWSQGVWPELVIAGARLYLPGTAPTPPADAVAAFTTNGMVWPEAAMPVPYLVHQAGSDDLSFAEVEAAIAAAFAAWQAVPCSRLRFTHAGTTDLGVAVDGQNVILFIEDGWIYGREAAGATSLWILDGEQTADVAMNGQHYRWAIGPPGSAFTAGTLDLQGVLTHELGHFSGLGHTSSAHDTMYYSWTPWPGQRTPSRDDKLGLCSLYPQAGDECTPPSTGCADGETCEPTAAGRLCDSPADPIGAACNHDRIECADFCLFTAADLSNGYCSRFCADDRDCPLTHHCDEASAGSDTVKVCFAGAQPPPPDAAVECVDDEGCPTGEYCSTMGACTLACRSDDDCAGAAACDDRGRCQPGGAGGCCGASPPGASLGLGGLVAALLARRRRRAPARARRG